MNIISLVQLFSEIIGFKVYAINFPEYKKGTFIKAEITSGISESGGVMDFNIELMVKAEHPAEAESVAIDLINKLDMITNRLFCEDKYQLILIQANKPQPFYVGETTSNEFIFSTDFRVLVTKI